MGRWRDAITGGGCCHCSKYNNDADKDDKGGGEGRHSGRECGLCRHDNPHWLLHPDQSKRVILKAFWMLKITALDGVGAALRHPVVMLSCTAISLAAAAKGGVGNGGGLGLVVHDNNGDAHGKFKSVNIGNVVAMFPAF